MITVTAVLRDTRDVAAWGNFMAVYMADREFVNGVRSGAKVAPWPPAAAAMLGEPEPTPLEAAIAKLDETPTAAELGNPTEKLAADPFAQLQSGTEPAAEESKPEKKPRKNAKKAEPAPEPEKPEDKPLTLDDIRKASTIALELVGAPTIQEALAKFGATDDKNVLRMSALRPQDYALYVDYLKKKVNDAAKEWPAA